MSRPEQRPQGPGPLSGGTDPQPESTVHDVTLSAPLEFDDVADYLANEGLFHLFRRMSLTNEAIVRIIAEIGYDFLMKPYPHPLPLEDVSEQALRELVAGPLCGNLEDDGKLLLIEGFKGAARLFEERYASTHKK